jgi:hypothetical protein
MTGQKPKRSGCRGRSRPFSHVLGRDFPHQQYRAARQQSRVMTAAADAIDRGRCYTGTVLIHHMEGI